MEIEKIIKTTNYTYIIKYAHKRYWRVVRITTETPHEIKVADPSNNPSKTIEDALTNPENLVYNYIHEI